MLKTNQLIENIDKKYIPMLKMVNIPDFYKCIAEFANISINDVDDNEVKNYLVTWAKNKYRFFKFLGNRLFVDSDFEFKREFQSEDKFKEIEQLFPAYFHWLAYFEKAKENRIDFQELSSRFAISLGAAFNNSISKFKDMKITRFFKENLNAPDELVTEIASIFEDTMIKATHTISIDPVDMMLASETPYNWDSCYKLMPGDIGSHADGTLAAVLDSASLITYVWNREGKYSLYGDYEFKNIRYKRLRQTIAISDDFSAVHFNKIYPKTVYSDSEVGKCLRKIVKDKIQTYLSLGNAIWINNSDNFKYSCLCSYKYGYSNEYSRDNIEYLKSDIDDNFETKIFYVFDEPIYSPDGCGNELPGSDSDVRYFGGGFIYDNYDEGYYWCECIGDWCEVEYGSDVCYCCAYWKEEHPFCEKTGEECCERNLRNHHNCCGCCIFEQD